MPRLINNADAALAQLRDDFESVVYDFTSVYGDLRAPLPSTGVTHRNIPLPEPI